MNLKRTECTLLALSKNSFKNFKKLQKIKHKEHILKTMTQLLCPLLHRLRLKKKTLHYKVQ